MPQTPTANWQTRLSTGLKQDPKKTGFLGFLVFVLLLLSVRMMGGGSHPALGAGSFTPKSVSSTPTFVPSPVIKPLAVPAALRGWLSGPIPPIGRNDFLVKSEYFPVDTTKTAAAPVPTGFWSSVEKSLSVQADQKDKRDVLIAKLKTQAAALRPTSIVAGPNARAMVNGHLLSEGDSIASFKVIRIEARQMVLEREGIELAVPMK